jgi:hypothetical protein
MNGKLQDVFLQSGVFNRRTIDLWGNRIVFLWKFVIVFLFEIFVLYTEDKMLENQLLQEVLLSVGLGLVMALTIIHFAGGDEKLQGKNLLKKQFASKEDEEEKKEKNAGKSYLPKVKKNFSNSPKARKFFGISENKIDEGIKEGEEIKDSLKENSMEPEEDVSSSNSSFEENVVPMFLVGLYTLLAALALYLGNMATDGLLFRIFVGLFPKEAKTLKMI